MRNNEEARLAVAFVNFMRYAYPQVTMFHVRNEGAVNEIQGKIFKDRGVLPGVHDYPMFWAPRCFATIELKREGKPAKYSPKQSEFAGYMDAAGFPHACCNSWQSIVAALLRFGLPATRYRFPPMDSSESNMIGQYHTLVSCGIDVPNPRGQAVLVNPFADLVKNLEI